MDNCFVPCGCETRQSITKSDLDRFTDKVENVINNEKGRRLFRNYMRFCKMKDGCRKLDLIEDIDKIINKNLNGEEAALKAIFKKAERIDELDVEIMTKLFNARSSENKEDMVDALVSLKTEITKALGTEYDVFKRHYTPSS